MIGRSRLHLVLLFSSICSQGQSLFNCVGGLYDPNGNNVTLNPVILYGMHCSLKVEFVSVEPCEIQSFELADEAYKQNPGHFMVDINEMFNNVYISGSSMDTDSESQSNSTTSTEKIDNFTAQVTNVTENVTLSEIQTTEIPLNETTLTSNSTENDTTTETTTIWNTKNKKRGVLSSLKFPKGQKDPTLPVVFTCHGEKCNKNLSFTETQIDQYLDLPKYRCIRKHIGEFEKILGAAFRNATKLKESNISSELFESDTVESTLPPTTTEKYEPPPDKHVPEGIPLYAVFLVSLVVSGALAAIREIRKKRRR